MVKHIILWKLKEEYTPEQKQKIMREIKEGLEGLNGKIPGLLSVTVQTEKSDTSTADLMLDTSFTDEQSYMAYRSHPAHIAVADGKVRPYVQTRLSMDYEV